MLTTAGRRRRSPAYAESARAVTTPGTTTWKRATSNCLIYATADPSVRAVVVTGLGNVLPWHEFSQPAARVQRRPDLPATRAPATDYALGVPKPLIAAIDGACAGIGFVQALMCDVRFTTPLAKWTPSFTRRGLASEDAVSGCCPGSSARRGRRTVALVPCHARRRGGCHRVGAPLRRTGIATGFGSRLGH